MLLQSRLSISEFSGNQCTLYMKFITFILRRNNKFCSFCRIVFNLSTEIGFYGNGSSASTSGNLQVGQPPLVGTCRQVSLRQWEPAGRSASTSGNLQVVQPPLVGTCRQVFLSQEKIEKFAKLQIKIMLDHIHTIYPHRKGNFKIK